MAGIVCYRLLPVAALPNVNYPTLQVTAQLPGASPQTVASSVTTPLETQFGEIPGLTQMTSSSALGFTQISLQFDLSRTVDSAEADVLAAINAAANRGIGLEDVRNVIGEQNVDLPKGTLNSPRVTYTLNTNDQLINPEPYNNMVLAYQNGGPVRVRDVGRAVTGPVNDLLAGWANSHPAIILAVQREPNANVIETVDRIKAMLPVLKASIPSAINVDILSDRTQTIRASIADVQFTLMITVALVVMVILLFLRNFWATIIPGITVPLSIVGTFAVLYELGYRIVEVWNSRP